MKKIIEGIIQTLYFYHKLLKKSKGYCFPSNLQAPALAIHFQHYNLSKKKEERKRKKKMELNLVFLRITKKNTKQDET